MKAILFALFALLAFSVTVQAQDCGKCELVIQFVEQWVESNATEGEILQYLDSLCSLFPSYAATCDSIAQQSLTQVLAWINQNETPQEICTQLGMCTSSKTIFLGKFNIPTIHQLSKLPSIKFPKPVSKPVTQVDDAECGGCEDVIGTIEQWLDETGNQDEVIQAVEVVCTYMPGWETTCDAIIAAGVPAVVGWIDEYENSTIVCNQLGLCGSTKKVEIVHVTDDCGECQQIVTVIENWVANGQNEQTIESYVETVCNLVPQWTQQCDTVIADAVPQIISWVEANESSQQICTNLGLCSSKAVPKPMKLKLI